MVNPDQRRSSWAALVGTLIALVAVYLLLGWGISATVHGWSDGVSVVDGISGLALVVAISALVRNRP